MSKTGDNTAVSEITARETFLRLNQDPTALLVDVRTNAEWTFVGLPVPPHGASPLLLEWQRFPDMSINDAFGRAVEAACPDKSTPLFFLCRSGVRSLAAAREMATRGYTACFNVSDGFEGPHDTEGHRGVTAGWKAAGLPWRQN